MNVIDQFLNTITMYRLVLYGLLVMVVYSFVASIGGQLSFPPVDLFLLLLTLTFSCYFGNLLLAKFFRITPNAESSIITALILYFLLWPSSEISNVLIFASAGLIAVASKYIVAYKRKHIFNPAAFAAVMLLFFNTGALWWVATPVMLPITLIIGLLFVRKIRRFVMFLTFIAVAWVFFLVQVQIRGLDLLTESLQFFASFPVVFFGAVMLTEPLTTPPTRKLQIMYASIVGLLFSWQGTTGPIILTTELVLIIGNVFSFAVSPKFKLRLTLLERKEIASDTFEYSFRKPPFFSFKPGQYLEWTLPFHKTDSRGNRRYFTIASSPTEQEIKLGIRFNEPPSSFKRFLRKLDAKKSVIASQLVGDFTMPKDPSQKLVFIAGGIGVTPFRSMIKYLLDKNEKRDIIFFYANKTENEIAYRELFDAASEKIGIKVVYILSDKVSVATGWKGESGRIDEAMLKKYVPDYLERLFYLSGPNAMVTNYKKILRSLKLEPKSIITDYFPGF